MNPGDLTLFDVGTFAETTVEPGSTIDERWAAFHQANPWVYTALRDLALDLVHRGRDRIGIGMLFEVLRWRWSLTTTGDEFKLNNNYRSRYARLLMADEPELDGVFETRVLSSAGADR